MQRSSVFFFFPRPTTVCWQHALLATAFSRIWKPSDRWGSNDIEASGLCFVRRSSNEGWYIELRDSEEITEQVNVSTTTWLHCYARRTALFTDSCFPGSLGALVASFSERFRNYVPAWNVKRSIEIQNDRAWGSRQSGLFWWRRQRFLFVECLSFFLFCANASYSDISGFLFVTRSLLPFQQISFGSHTVRIFESDARTALCKCNQSVFRFGSSVYRCKTSFQLVVLVAVYTLRNVSNTVSFPSEIPLFFFSHWQGLRAVMTSGNLFDQLRSAAICLGFWEKRCCCFFLLPFVIDHWSKHAFNASWCTTFKLS